MSRKIRVSTLGGENLTTLREEGMEKAVEKMVRYWEGRLSKVVWENSDLIVLPECCDRYVNFSPEERLEYYDYRGDRMLDYFASVAKEKNCYMAYSTVMREADGKNRNSTVMIDRQGQVMGRYNKHNLTMDEIDMLGGLCGKDAVIFDCDFGRVGAVICFDLNFEEIRNLYREKNPDLMIFPSNYHGGFMQNFWAYELRSWLVTAVGCNNLSGVVNPVGVTVAQTSNYRNWLTKEINLDCFVAHLDENWEKVEKAKKKYGPGLQICEPGQLGAMLLSSDMDHVTMDQIVAEFGIAQIDDYFARSIKKADENREK